MLSDNNERLGFFGLALQDVMKREGVTINQLAGRVAHTYEFVRGLVNCKNLPSDSALCLICSVLKLNLTRMRRLVLADKLRHKYGNTIWLLVGKIPELEPLYILAPYLTEEQKSDLIIQMQALVRQNKHPKVGRRATTARKER